jgi:phenylalanyl-tRNA synthetase beta chain
VTPVGGAVSGVVVAQVESAQKHPNADKLKLCEVFDGVPATRWCVALPTWRRESDILLHDLGAKLPDGLVIEKRPCAGSSPTACCVRLGNWGWGGPFRSLYPVAADALVGQDIAETLALNDVILEIEVTPNRPDALSHWGLAREISAGLGKSMRDPKCRSSIDGKTNRVCGWTNRVCVIGTSRGCWRGSRSGRLPCGCGSAGTMRDSIHQ